MRERGSRHTLSRGQVPSAPATAAPATSSASTRRGPASAPPEETPFLYALFDEGSGREFQSGPILSIAGLGSSDGKRPFRYFATPITFSPLSTIRMEITELGRVRGELHVALHGYKMLGGPAVETRDRERRRRR